MGRNKMALFFGHMPWKETTVIKWRCFSDSIACEVASDKSAVTKWRCFLGFSRGTCKEVGLGSPPNKQSNSSVV